MMQAAIKPSVLAATPISTALVMPSLSMNVGPQATVVPSPPVSETDPAISPALGSMPQRRGDAHAEQVLHHDEHGHQRDHHRQRPPARNEVADVGLEPDARRRNRAAETAARRART